MDEHLPKHPGTSSAPRNDTPYSRDKQPDSPSIFPALAPTPPSAPAPVLFGGDVPPKPDAPGVPGDAEHPLAVTEVYSSYGMEYFIMLISLGVAAVSLSSLLSAILDLATTKSQGLAGTFFNPYAEAALIVSFPIFAYLFLRLEAREETHESFLVDASRRRGIQAALLVSFVVLIGELIAYIGGLLNGGSDPTAFLSSDSGSWWVRFLHALINVAISGVIFGYFWYKLHKKTGPGQL